MDTETLSLIIALVAVIAGPFVSWHIAKRQISAQVVSSNRQNWIDEFRETLAEFLRDCSTLNRGYAGDVVSHSEAYSRYENVVLAIRKIELMINPEEENHRELLRMMKSVDSLLRTTMQDAYRKDDLPDQDLAKIQGSLDTIVTLGQRIFKSEWNRVKAGE